VTSVAHGPVARRAPGRKAEARRQPVAFAGGIAWIVVMAVLLAGVVAINVAVLRLNLQLDATSRDKTQLQGDVSLLRSELSSAAATSRIERLARGELGMVPADPDKTVYVRLDR
jgi:cell division protein FtsL